MNPLFAGIFVFLAFSSCVADDAPSDTVRCGIYRNNNGVSEVYGVLSIAEFTSKLFVNGWLGRKTNPEAFPDGTYNIYVQENINSGNDCQSIGSVDNNVGKLLSLQITKGYHVMQTTQVNAEIRGENSIYHKSLALYLEGADSPVACCRIQ